MSEELKLLELRWKKFTPTSRITFEEVVLILESLHLKIEANNSVIFKDNRYEPIRKYFKEDA